MNEHPFILERDKQILTLEGKNYSKKDVLVIAKKYAEDNRVDIYGKLFNFLALWYDNNTSLEVRTSGSTGVPKFMQIEKKRMMESACLTCTFFTLSSLQKTLLCMPLEYIGAKMLVVRALIAGLDLYLVKPSLHPFLDVMNTPNYPHTFDFIPMTPQQAWVTLTGLTQEANFSTSTQSQRENYQEISLFKNTKHILLGGMAVGEELEEKIIHFPNAIWSSYGMTETLSHIALRKVNGKDASFYFTPLEGVKVELSAQSTLIIDAPKISKERLYTNDYATILADGSFRILGRLDNCINSGGIKIQLEEVESLLAKLLKGSEIAFQVTSLADPELGHKVVLLLEKTCDFEFTVRKVKEKIKLLPKYLKPKNIFLVETLPYTESGKPDRCFAKEIAKKKAKEGGTKTFDI